MLHCAHCAHAMGVVSGCMRSRNGLLPEANKLTSVQPSARSTAAQCGTSKSVRCSFSLALRQNTHTSLGLHYRPPAEDAVLTRARPLGAEGAKGTCLLSFRNLGSVGLATILAVTFRRMVSVSSCGKRGRSAARLAALSALHIRVRQRHSRSGGDGQNTPAFCGRASRV